MDSTMLWINEGYMQDDAGNLVITSYVDLREPDSKRRIRTLTKGCRREHALEDSETVLMSPLKRFREEGAKLIQDAQEGLAKEETETVEPETPEEAIERRRAEELNEAVELTGSQIRIRRRVRHRKVHRSKDTFSFGKEWWIFSTAITPETDEEWGAWRATLDAAYDHESEIGQPAKFAEALARMVAEQLGPQGKDGWAKSRFGGAQELRSRHGTQWVIHGPVVYVDSVYEALSGEMDEESRIAASMFTKSASHAAMREYRFVILRDGTVDDKVPLRISGMMRDALEPTEHGLVRRAPQETGVKTPQSQPGKRSSRTTKEEKRNIEGACRRVGREQTGD